METTRLRAKLSVDRHMDGYPAVAEATAGLPTVPAPRIEDRLRPLTLCRSAWLPCAKARTSANRVSTGGKGHPGGVHGVSELLRRVGSPERLSPVAQRVEDEGNLKRMARTEASVELR